MTGEDVGTGSGVCRGEALGGDEETDSIATPDAVLLVVGPGIHESSED